MEAPHISIPRTDEFGRRWFLRGLIVLACCLPLASVACAGRYYLEPENVLPSQEQGFVDGYPFLVEIEEGQQGLAYAVSVFGYVNRDLLVLNVRYTNASAFSIDARPDLISVLGRGESRIRSLKVWEANRYIARVARRQEAAEIVSAISGAIGAGMAGYSHSSTVGSVSGNYQGSTGGSYHGSTSGRYGRHGRYSGSNSGSYSGSSQGSFGGSYHESTTTYDAGKVAMAEAANAQRLQAMRASHSENLQYLNQNLLKRQTLAPGQSIQGLVYVERRILAGYRVLIPFGDRTFYFDFKPTKFN